MIGRRGALALAGTAILGGGTGVWLAGDPPTPDLAPGKTLFPDLALRLQRAARVEVTHRGATLSVQRASQGWVLPQHAAYPIRPSVLHSLLAGLAGLRLQEPRTDDPALYPRLGLDDPGHRDSAGTLLRVADGAGATLAAVLFGHGPDGIAPETYVRRPGEARAWLAAGDLDASTDWLDCVDRTVVDVLPETVSRITSQREGAPPLTVERQGGALALIAPQGHGATDADRLGDMARALSHLRFLDVAEAAAALGRAVGTASVALQDGLVLLVSAIRDAAVLWLRLSATGTGAEVLQARLAPWAFAVPDAVEPALFPTLADLAAFQVAAMPPPPGIARPRRR